MRVQLSIQFQRMKDRGETEWHGGNRYTIRINKDEPVLAQFMAFIHEATHLWVYMTFDRDGNQDREHEFTDKMERAAKRAGRWFLGGKA